MVIKVCVWYEHLRQSPLCVIWLNSGYHFVGEGHRIPIDSEEKSEERIAEMKRAANVKRTRRYEP